MSDEPQTDDQESVGESAEEARFDLPVVPEDESSEPRLRRRIFGYRPDDVEAAINSRDTMIRELRRDVTALWLAFGQHERTIMLLVEATEALGGPRLESPGGRTRPDPASHPDDEGVPAQREPSQPDPGRPSEEPLAAGAIAEQLAGLDEVLAAIEGATRSLEQAYADEIAGGVEGPETAGTGEGGRAAEAGEDPEAAGAGEGAKAGGTDLGGREGGTGESSTAADANRSPASAEPGRVEADDEESR